MFWWAGGAGLGNCRPGRYRLGNPSIDLIGRVVRFSLDRGCHVVVEGTLTVPRYGSMCRQLADDHLGRSRLFRFDVPILETLRRHATKPNADEFGEPGMRAWWLG